MTNVYLVKGPQLKNQELGEFFFFYAMAEDGKMLYKTSDKNQEEIDGLLSNPPDELDNKCNELYQDDYQYSVEYETMSELMHARPDIKQKNHAG